MCVWCASPYLYPVSDVSASEVRDIEHQETHQRREIVAYKNTAAAECVLTLCDQRLTGPARVAGGGGLYG